MSANTAVAGQRITAAWLNTNIPGPYQAITPQNSWANTGGGSVAFQARLYNSVTAEVIGEITGGGITGGTLIGTLPSNCLPVSGQTGQAIVTAPGADDGMSIEVAVGSSGAMKIWGAPTGTTGLSFHFFVSLDA